MSTLLCTVFLLFLTSSVSSSDQLSQSLSSSDSLPPSVEPGTGAGDFTGRPSLFEEELPVLMFKICDSCNPPPGVGSENRNLLMKKEQNKEKHPKQVQYMASLRNHANDLPSLSISYRISL